MAYAALSSLMYTLQQLLNPNQSLLCRSSTQQHLQSIYQNISAMQLFLDDTTTKDIETLKVIEKRIRDVVYKAEDKVDSSLRNIILADCTENREGACKFFEEELLKVEKDVDSLSKEVMQIEFNKHGSRSAELATTHPSSPGKSRLIEENTIVGMEDDFNTILDRITAQTDELTVIPIFGMGGIEIIRRTPNLKKLKILDKSKHPDWPNILDSLNLLEELETLQISTEQTIDPMIFSRDIFPPDLNKLTLTDWRLNEDVVFRKLKRLLLYKCRDLQRWEAAGSDNFPMLEKLILRGFSQLEEIPESVGEIMTLKLIRIDWCASGVDTSAKKIQEEQQSWGNYELQVQIIPEFSHAHLQMERFQEEIRISMIVGRATRHFIRYENDLEN